MRRISLLLLSVFLIGCGLIPSQPEPVVNDQPLVVPTISGIFGVSEDQEATLETIDSSASTELPIPTVAPVATAPLLPTAVPVNYETIEDIVFDDGVTTNWSLKHSNGTEFDPDSTNATFSGTTALEFTPTADFGSVYFAVSETSDTIYYREDVLGFKFQLYTGDDILDPGSLAVSIIGSNDHTYFVEGDDSVLGVAGSGPIFPETRLYFLGFDRVLPADSWFDVELWLDDLVYDPEYDFVTGLVLRNDEGFYRTLVVDDVKIMRTARSTRETVANINQSDQATSLTLADVFVRQGPSLGDTLLTRLSANTPVNIMGYEGDWANISFVATDGAEREGWVSRFEVRGGDEGVAVVPAPTQTPQPTFTPETQVQAQFPSTATPEPFVVPTEAPVDSVADSNNEQSDIVAVPLIPTPSVTNVPLPTQESAPQPVDVVEEAPEIEEPVYVCRTADELAFVQPQLVAAPQPWSRWTGEGKVIDFVDQSGTDNQLLGLTFDAEGDAGSVWALLDVLDKRRVKATFFIEGQWAQDNPALVREMAKRGHEFGNHAFSGARPIDMNTDELILEIANTEALVQALTGQSTLPYFRPPYGDRDDEMIREIGQQGYFTVVWTAASNDIEPETTADEMCSQLMEKSFSGAIMLNHTFNPKMPEVIDRYVGEMQDRGFTFVPLSILLADDPAGLLLAP